MMHICEQNVKSNCITAHQQEMEASDETTHASLRQQNWQCSHAHLA